MKYRTYKFVFFLFLIAVHVFSNGCLAKDKKEKISELMNQYYENGQFYGTILVAERGKVIYQGAFGYANLEWKIPNTLDTKFRIASITKTFTAMLVLQQVEEGNLRLDGKITEYLPDYPKETGDKITIHHLLTHTSGIIGEGEVPDLEDVERIYHTHDEMMKYFSKKDLSFEPGSSFQYSNFGYLLLGMILEKVTGKSYEELLEEKIGKPSGMKNTRPDDNKTPVEKRASGYHHKFLTGAENGPLLDMSFVFGYGHLLSTVEDLYLWDQALYNDKLLSKKYREMMLKPVKEGYGYGISISEQRIGETDDSVKAISHSGSINGFKSEYLHVIEDNHLIVILSNHKESPNNHLIFSWIDSEIPSNILAILYDREYQLPKKSAAYAVAQEIVQSGNRAAVDKLHDLQANHQDQYSFHTAEFSKIGLLLFEMNKVEEALDILKLNIGAFPNSADAKRCFDWVQTLVQAEKNPVILSTETMEKYAGDYGPRHIRSKNGCLYYQRGGGEEIRLRPLNHDTLTFENNIEIRIHFLSDESGSVIKIELLFFDGSKDESPRDK